VKPRALLLAALAATGAWAEETQDFTLEATTDLLYLHNLLATGPRAFGPPARRDSQYQYGLSLVGNLGPWTGELTVRDVDFYQQDPNITLNQGTSRIYKKYIKFDAAHWNLQAGDFNTMLGRGLVLSVIQNPAILMFNTIDGGDARYRSGRLELHALNGSVTTEKQDQSWWVEGGEATVEVLPGNRVGIRASSVRDERLPRFGPPVGRRLCRSASLSGQDLPGGFSYYAERAHMDFPDQQPALFPTLVDPRKGDGAYGNLSFHHQAWVLMAETKNYKNFDNGLNNPPLADRDTEKNDQYDGAGQRLYAQYSFPDPDLTLFGSAGAYRDENFAGHNVFGGFKLQDGFDRLDLAWTYGLKTVFFLEKRTDATLTWRLTPLWSLDLTLRDKRNRPPGSDPYEETDLTVQVARSPRFAVYLMQQRTSVAVFEATRLFYGGVRVNFRKGSYVDCSAGRLRGGEVCAGGQCITLPPFEGWKLAAHWRW
jgi:hypothetical protein